MNKEFPVSKSKEERVKCPACGQPGSFTLWESVNVTADPVLKERFMSGDLNTFRCAGCQNETQVWYPMLYHDMDLLLMVWFMPGGETPPPVPELLTEVTGDNAETYRFRLVRSPNELKEKVFLADAGLDDRVVELMKWLVRQNDHGESLRAEDILLFAEIEEGKSGRQIVFVVMSGAEQFTSGLPFSLYSELADTAEPHLETLYPGEGPWLNVHERHLAAPEV
jgi:hypothetical protein